MTKNELKIKYFIALLLLKHETDIEVDDWDEVITKLQEYDDIEVEVLNNLEDVNITLN
jgi:hypothetical protein